MSARGVRIVVGEGDPSRQGLLRFVLSGEGYDVVGEATNAAELARELAIHRPQVVVLDDGIGATSVGMVREMLPGAKTIVIWPEGVVAISGATRVEPARVLQDLGPAVERLTGVTGERAAGEGPAAVDRAKRDPAVLQRMLHNASVIDLATRAPRVDLSVREGTAAASSEPIIEDREPAPVVILPVSPGLADHDEVVHIPDASEDASGDAREAGTGASDEAPVPEDQDEPDRAGAVGAAAGVAAAGVAAAGVVTAAGVAAGASAQSSLNRRLGNVALAGAAVAGALVLAIALGGAKVPVASVSAEAPTFPNPVIPGDDPGGSNGDGGVDGTGHGNGSGPGNGSDIGSFYPIQPFEAATIPVSFIFPSTDGRPDLGTIVAPSGDPKPSGDHKPTDPKPSGGNDKKDGDRSSGGGSSGDAKGSQGTSGDASKAKSGSARKAKRPAFVKRPDLTPGRSGEHNPHGGPPGLSGLGQGQGGTHSAAGGRHGHHRGQGHGPEAGSDS